MIETNDPVTPELFREAMRSYVTGVCLVTSWDGLKPVGLAASSVVSVSIEPPTLLVAVNRVASAHDTLVNAGAFAINILAEQHTKLVHVFSNTELIDERFKIGEWRMDQNQCPILVDSPASFSCKTKTIIDGGTHSIFLGEVTNVRVCKFPPLLYGYGTFGSFKGNIS